VSGQLHAPGLRGVHDMVLLNVELSSTECDTCYYIFNLALQEIFGGINENYFVV